MTKLAGKSYYAQKFIPCSTVFSWFRSEKKLLEAMRLSSPFLNLNKLCIIKELPGRRQSWVYMTWDIQSYVLSYSVCSENKKESVLWKSSTNRIPGWCPDGMSTHWFYWTFTQDRARKWALLHDGGSIHQVGWTYTLAITEGRNNCKSSYWWVLL